MKCAKCGSEVPDRGKFCLECGARISGISAASNVEVDATLGNLQTMVRVPGAASLVGDAATMQGGAASDVEPGTSEGLSGEPLASRYEIVQQIGQGGFARVFGARDKRLDRTVAVKRLLVTEGRSQDAQTVERFHREARAIAGLNHRNIVAVYDHNRDAEGDYIVMEYVEGGTLRDYAQKRGGKLPVPEAVSIVRSIAQGLAHAHRKGLVHRDIKPSNILMGDDGGDPVPKIVDFGLARTGNESNLSVSGYGMGTPYYMAPEQRRDAKSVNHTADIYALGKTLYELVTGSVPDTVDPEEIPPPPVLSRIILKCVKPNPADRYFSAEELIAALGELGGAARPSDPAHAPSGNDCPSCGAGNPSDSKFCEKCGAGLTYVCPECGRENSIQKAFCGGCGSDIEAFNAISSAVTRMEQLAADKRHSRVIKESELVSQYMPRLKGEKARSMIAAIQRMRSQAEAAESERQRIEESLREGFADRQSAAQVGTLIEKYKSLVGSLPQDLALLEQRLPARTAIEQATRAMDDAQKHLARNRFVDCHHALEKASPAAKAVFEKDAADLAAVAAKADRMREEMTTRWLGILDAQFDADVTRIQCDIQEARWEDAAAKLKALRNPAAPDLPGQPVADVVTRDRRVRELETLIRGSRTKELRNRIEVAEENEEWDAARDAAATLLALYPDDAEAQESHARAARKSRMKHALSAARKGLESGQLRDCVTATHELELAGSGEARVAIGTFKGTVVELKRHVLARMPTVDQATVEIQRAVRERKWARALRLARAVVAEFPAHEAALDAIRKASAAIRSQRLAAICIAAVALIATAVAVYLIHARVELGDTLSELDRAIADRKWGEARLLAAELKSKDANAAHIDALLPIREDCVALIAQGLKTPQGIKDPDAWAVHKQRFEEVERALGLAGAGASREVYDSARKGLQAQLACGAIRLIGVSARGNDGWFAQVPKKVTVGGDERVVEFPAVIAGVPVGDAEVSVDIAGYQLAETNPRSVKVGLGETTTVSMVAEPLPAQVSFEIDPSWAEVAHADGRPIGIRSGPQSFSPLTNHALNVSLNGYESQSLEFSALPGVQTTLVVKLSRQGRVEPMKPDVVPGGGGVAPASVWPAVDPAIAQVTETCRQLVSRPKDLVLLAQLQRQGGQMQDPAARQGLLEGVELGRLLAGQAVGEDVRQSLVARYGGRCPDCNGQGQTQKICPTCKGTKVCSQCRGAGTIAMRFKNDSVRCPACQGSRTCANCAAGGRYGPMACGTCGGRGTVLSRTTAEARYYQFLSAPASAGER